MHIEKHTCPFTGGSFNAVHMSNDWVVTHPLTGETIRCPYNASYVLVPRWAMGEIDTMTPTEAAENLGVSRQRVDQLSAAGKLCQRYVNGSPVFTRGNVLKYKDSRKNGRPRKE